MADFSQMTERILAGKAWIPAAIIVAVAFGVATATSLFVGFIALPKAKQAGGTLSEAVAAIRLPESLLTPEAITRDIVNRNIFSADGKTGEEVESAEPAEGDPEEPVKSKLPLSLLGVISGGRPDVGIAVIENTEKKSVSSFWVSESVMPGVTVFEIYPEKVMLLRSGRKEYVEMQKFEIARGRKRKAQTQAPAVQTLSPLATTAPPENFKEDGFSRVGTRIEMTRAVRDRLLSVDFTRVLQDAKAEPNLVNGELKGFRLTRIRKDSIYEKAGFRNDDVIEEINGIPLTDAAQSIKLLNSLRAADEIEVRVARGGAPVNVSLNVQ